MKICRNCKWWDRHEWETGFCDNPEIDLFCNSWHPQKLPDWINIKIIKKFSPKDNFGCVLWEKR